MGTKTECIARLKGISYAVEYEFNPAAKNIAGLLSLMRDGISALRVDVNVVDRTLEKMAVLIWNDAFERNARPVARSVVQGNAWPFARAKNGRVVRLVLLKQPAYVGLQYPNQPMKKRKRGQSAAILHFRQQAFRALGTMREFLQRQALGLSGKSQLDADSPSRLNEFFRIVGALKRGAGTLHFGARVYRHRSLRTTAGTHRRPAVRVATADRES